MWIPRLNYANLNMHEKDVSSVMLELRKRDLHLRHYFLSSAEDFLQPIVPLQHSTFIAHKISCLLCMANSN